MKKTLFDDKLNPWHCLTSDMVQEERNTRRANYNRGYRSGIKKGALKELEDLLPLLRNCGDMDKAIIHVCERIERIKELERGEK